MTSTPTHPNSDRADADAATRSRLHELAFFLGRWDAPGEFHQTPFGARKDIEMTIETTMEENGHWIMVRTTELSTPTNPAPLTARYLWGYDAGTDSFTADWFDSNGGHAVQRSIGWQGDTFVLQGTMTMAGNSVPLRDSFIRTGPDSYDHLGEVDLGTGWMAVDEERATRTHR